MKEFTSKRFKEIDRTPEWCRRIKEGKLKYAIKNSLYTLTNTLTGEEFPTVKLAAESIGITKSALQSIVCGKTIKNHTPFTWVKNKKG